MDVLARGGLVAMPTETVYGLAADATNTDAVLRIYEAKGRPRFNPLIAHVADLEAAMQLAEFSAVAVKLAEAFWPGPMTLVLPRRPGSAISDLVTSGLETIALRVPGHAVTRDLIAAYGRPLAAPSANRSGHVSPTTAAHVMDDLGGRIDLILDAGSTSVGVESTILLCPPGDGNPKLLRPGGIDLETISAAIGIRPDQPGPSGDRPNAPGQLESHYAPSARLRLCVKRPEPGEALLAFGPDLPPHCGPLRNLSQSGDLREAAANLFAALRELDASGARSIAVMPIPGEGLGEAINDRLLRAAAPRP